MGYSIGWDSNNARWKGYGVPCTCEQPGCTASIDRGMAYLCEDCGLAFCGEHLGSKCERCINDEPAFPAKPESQGWLRHLRTHPSWAKWREENEPKLKAWETASQRAQAQQKGPHES
jgi:hypothetical protein